MTRNYFSILPLNRLAQSKLVIILLLSSEKKYYSLSKNLIKSDCITRIKIIKSINFHENVFYVHW